MIAGCSKTEDMTLRYPKTELANTKWKRFNFRATIGGNDVYEFLNFSKNTVDIYAADEDGKGEFDRKTYPYKLNLSDKNMDSFEIFLSNGKSGGGSTTDNVNVITYNYYEFNRVK